MIVNGFMVLLIKRELNSCWVIIKICLGEIHSAITANSGIFSLHFSMILDLKGDYDHPGGKIDPASRLQASIVYESER